MDTSTGENAELPFDPELIVRSAHEMKSFRSMSLSVYVFSAHKVDVLYTVSQSFPIDVYNMLDARSRITLKEKIFEKLIQELVYNYEEYRVSEIKLENRI